MVFGKVLTWLMVPLAAVWLPLARCCVTEAWAPGEAAATAAAQASDACHACGESPAPGDPLNDEQHPAPHRCGCGAIVPAPTEWGRTVGVGAWDKPAGPALGAAFMPVAWVLAEGPVAAARDCGPGNPGAGPQGRSLFAQSCLLIV